jgi:hypothetical protein
MLLRKVFLRVEYDLFKRNGTCRALHARAAATVHAPAGERDERVYAYLARAAEGNPFKDALRILQTTRGEPLTLTTSQLNRHVRALAAGLRGELGLLPGDRIASWLPSGSAEFIILALASAASGLELVSLPPPRRILRTSSPLPPKDDTNTSAQDGVVDDITLERALRMLQKYPPRGLICWHDYEVIPRAVAARMPSPERVAPAGSTLSSVLYDNLDVPVQLVRALFLAPPTAAAERSPVTCDSAGLAGFTPLTGHTIRPQPALVPQQLEFVAHTGPENLRTLLRYRNMLVYDADPHPLEDNLKHSHEKLGTFIFCEPEAGQDGSTGHFGAGKDCYVHLDEMAILKHAQTLAQKLGGMHADHGDVAHGRVVLSPRNPERAHRVMITGLFAALTNGTLAIVPSYDANAELGSSIAEKQGGTLLVHELSQS